MKEYRVPPEHDVLRFVVEKSTERIVVYDSRHAIVYQNCSAKTFLDRHELPEEVPSLTERLFKAIAAKKTAETFPGHISFSKEIGERRWVFTVAWREDPYPLVCVYFTDETVSSCFDLNALRQQHKLTRRETDVLRHLLDGLSNLEISEELGVIEQTVKDHVSGVFGKLGVHDRFTLLRQLIGTPRQ